MCTLLLLSFVVQKHTVNKILKWRIRHLWLTPANKLHSCIYIDESKYSIWQIEYIIHLMAPGTIVIYYIKPRQTCEIQHWHYTHSAYWLCAWMLTFILWTKVHPGVMMKYIHAHTKMYIAKSIDIKFGTRTSVHCISYQHKYGEEDVGGCCKKYIVVDTSAIVKLSFLFMVVRPQARMSL